MRPARNGARRWPPRPPALKVQAARLASGWGWYAQAIATLAQANEWDDVPLRYPRPYASEVAQASKLTSVPADWILAIMRQESLFRKDAVSRADARGLMQMLPATAAPSPALAHARAEPRRAVRPATWRCRSARPMCASCSTATTINWPLSLAAYNAGPAAVARWMPPQSIDADIWIENIPYTETRSYVQHVLEHIVAFAAVRDAEPPRLSALLPPMRPRRGTPAQINPF